MVRHDFNPLSQFCRQCGIPLRAICNHPRLAKCTPENLEWWKQVEVKEERRRAQVMVEIEASQAKDREPLPAGATFGDLRRALGFDRWPM